MHKSCSASQKRTNTNTQLDKDKVRDKDKDKDRHNEDEPHKGGSNKGEPNDKKQVVINNPDDDPNDGWYISWSIKQWLY